MLRIIVGKLRSAKLCAPEGLILVVTPLKPHGGVLDRPRITTGKGLLSLTIVSPFQNRSGWVKGCRDNL